MTPSELEVVRVEFASERHERTFQLRKRVLLDPFAIHYSEEARRAEDVAFHFGVFVPRKQTSEDARASSSHDVAAVSETEVCIACAFLVALDEATLRMRQVAVEFGWQESGFGRRVVTAVEGFGASRGFSKMVAHARQSAVPFYERLGYAVVGEPFVEVGLPHRFVEKSLVPGV